ncbi:MAG: cyclopropane fatty acyl phospholipid synthase [Candidatus Accumulibacter sp. BA-94]|uniref:class I SAM-dependent methyltransferase n=1 Tax=Accumulibacter sp. TaxID=2053492 RepID=UPI0004502F17|nr:class I SAM-dependent methyltransferase [Accumulibacter sp.]EXI88284.1 MAG: cyclopropane fatty acyl phospholipid synthase [Candidatus Accumulibacter sp. BA-94]
MLPSRSAFRHRAAAAGLVVHDAFGFGSDYARTLAEWSARLERQWPRIAALGFDERFRQLWRFNLACCEAGFSSKCIDVVQFELRHAP